MVAAVEALTGGHEPAPTPLRVRLCRRLALGRWARDRERELATTGVGNGGEGTHPCELFSGGEDVARRLWPERQREKESTVWGRRGKLRPAETSGHTGTLESDSHRGKLPAFPIAMGSACCHFCKFRKYSVSYNMWDLMKLFILFFW
jgi:hypothetical protein